MVIRIIENQTFDMERALYGSEGVLVKSCSFDGPADGESAFKECSDIAAENCFFNLHYPFWHNNGLKISGSEMKELCRASRQRKIPRLYAITVGGFVLCLHGILHISLPNGIIAYANFYCKIHSFLKHCHIGEYKVTLNCSCKRYYIWKLCCRTASGRRAMLPIGILCCLKG